MSARSARNAALPPRGVLLVVAKAPVAGLAKTRLCPPATRRQAAAIAAASLLDTIDAAASLPGPTRVLAYTGDLDAASRAGEIRRALAGWCLIPQRGTAFADRLANAHADVAARFPGAPVLQLGMDTPQISPALLAAALAALAGADAVLGPAADGGWWALGLRDPLDAAALRGVPMSTASTGALTHAALGARGLAVAKLPLLCDVDGWQDALAVAATMPRSRFAAAVNQVASLLVERR